MPVYLYIQEVFIHAFVPIYVCTDRASFQLRLNSTEILFLFDFSVVWFWACLNYGSRQFRIIDSFSRSWCEIFRILVGGTLERKMSEIRVVFIWIFFFFLVVKLFFGGIICGIFILIVIFKWSKERDGISLQKSRRRLLCNRWLLLRLEWIFQRGSWWGSWILLASVVAHRAWSNNS